MNIVPHNTVPYGIIPTKQVVGDTVLQPTITHNYTPTVEQNRSGSDCYVTKDTLTDLNALLLKLVREEAFNTALKSTIIAIVGSVGLNQLIEHFKTKTEPKYYVPISSQPIATIASKPRSGSEGLDVAKLFIDMVQKASKTSIIIPLEVTKALGEGLGHIEMGEYHRNTGNLIEARKQWETGLQKVKSLIVPYHLILMLWHN
jgi:hypothetical protein